MNSILLLMLVTGFLCLAAACLRTLEVGPVSGPAFSPAARVVLLALVFLMIFSAIEALASKTPSRPGGSATIFVLGLFSAWRSFAPAWASFFTNPGAWHFRFGSPPKA